MIAVHSPKNAQAIMVTRPTGQPGGAGGAAVLPDQVHLPARRRSPQHPLGQDRERQQHVHRQREAQRRWS